MIIPLDKKENEGSRQGLKSGFKMIFKGRERSMRGDSVGIWV